jgi:hypothetical protein
MLGQGKQMSEGHLQTERCNGRDQVKVSKTIPML